MNIIELRNKLNDLINIGYGDKRVGIAQVTDQDYDKVGGFDVSSDLTTLLICTWDRANDLIAEQKN